eukprot:4204373-Alexandrium_andersonii.AAC.1
MPTVPAATPLQRGPGTTSAPGSKPRARASTHASATTAPEASKRTGNPTAAALAPAAFVLALPSCGRAVRMATGKPESSVELCDRTSRSFTSACTSRSCRTSSSLHPRGFCIARKIRTRHPPTAGSNAESGNF